MNEEIATRWICDLPAHYGRCMGIASYRDKVLIAMEFGAVLELKYDYVTDSYGVEPVRPADSANPQQESK